MKYVVRSGWQLGLLAASLFLAGCIGNTRRDLDIKDHSTVRVSGSVVWEPKGLRHNERTGGAILLGYDEYKASDEYLPTDTQDVYIGSSSLPGAQPFNTKISYSAGYLAYEHAFGLGSHLQLAPRVGAGYGRIKVTVTEQGNTQRSVTDTQRQWLVTAGFTPRWYFSDVLFLEGTFDWQLSGFSSVGFEGGIVYRPIKHIDVRLGGFYREGSYESGDDTNTPVVSTIPLKTLIQSTSAGLDVAVRLRF